MPAVWHVVALLQVNITVQSDDYGCYGCGQRVVSLLLMVSLAKRTPRRIRAAQFAEVPVDTFDISGCERFETKTTLMLDATGGAGRITRYIPI